MIKWLKRFFSNEERAKFRIGQEAELELQRAVKRHREKLMEEEREKRHKEAKEAKEAKEKYITKIDVWLNEKWPKDKRKCEVCEKTEWLMDYNYSAVTPCAHWDNPSSYQWSGHAYNNFIVICENCSNTKSFNLVHMGLVDAKKDTK